MRVAILQRPRLRRSGGDAMTAIDRPQADSFLQDSKRDEALDVFTSGA